MDIRITNLKVDRAAGAGSISLLWTDHGSLDVATLLEPSGDQDADETQVKGRAVEILEAALSALRSAD